MRKNGYISVSNFNLKYIIEVADEAKDYGIDGGRIVKLEIIFRDTTVAYFEYGNWILYPRCVVTLEAMHQILLGVWK